MSNETAISAGASSTSDRLVGTPTAPAVSDARKLPSEGATVKLRPGTACSSSRATRTSDAGDAINGDARTPSSNEYVVARHGVTDGVGVPVCVPVALDEGVPVALLEPVPVVLDDDVPVWLSVPVTLLEPVPVALDEAVPVWLPVALLEPVPVELGEAVPVWLPVAVELLVPVLV